MFHPEILRTEVAMRLRAPPELVYRRRGPAFPVRGSTGRIHFLAVAVVFSVPVFLARWRRRYEAATLVAASLALALLGAVVWSLAIASAIPAVRYNEAVLVVVPLDAVLPLLSLGWQRRYARVRLAGLAVVTLLGIVGVLHQPLWIVILAVALPMATVGFDLPYGPLGSPGDRA